MSLVKKSIFDISTLVMFENKEEVYKNIGLVKDNIQNIESYFTFRFGKELVGVVKIKTKNTKVIWFSTDLNR